MKSVNMNYRAVRVSEHVHWVGAVDWGIRDFHGYSTNRGTTYNAYLMMGDEITLVDTVKAPFREEMISRITSVVNPTKIDYIISNHSEMDHSGCLPQLIEIVRPKKVFASAMGVKALGGHFHMDKEIIPVKDGESLTLGNLNLTFVETRMLHWPDSMFTYLAEDSLLFSQDAFGMHLATSQRFSDEIEEPILDWEAAKYYANILLPFSPLVAKLLDKVGRLSLRIDILAPDHGPVWRKDIGRIVEDYSTWSSQKRRNKAVIAYDTMWQSTAAMAHAVAEGLVSGGTEVKMAPLKSSHRSEIATEMLDAGALLVGSPTMNNCMFPTVADLLIYLKGLKPKNLVGGAFGSYGWSGEAVGQVSDLLKEMGVVLVKDDLKVKWVPGGDGLRECWDMGKAVSDKLRETCGSGERS
jgi:flavorubredoxin